MPAFTEDIATLSGDIAVLSEDVATLSGDIAVLSEDVAVLSEDVAALSEDMAVLSEDVVVLSEDLAALSEDMVALSGFHFRPWFHLPKKTEGRPGGHTDPLIAGPAPSPIQKEENSTASTTAVASPRARRAENLSPV